MTEPSETDVFEYKSEIDWSNKTKYSLAKTIAAFANTKGGTIQIGINKCKRKELDPANLHTTLASIFDPPIEGITTSTTKHCDIEINVSKSNNRPHVAKKDCESPNKNGSLIKSISRGQVFFRRSGKNDVASHYDYSCLIREVVDERMKDLGRLLTRHGIALSDDIRALPVRLTDGDSSIEMRPPDISRAFPYTAGGIGELVGKTATQIGTLANQMGLKGDPSYHQEIKTGPSSRTHLYSDAALARVREFYSCSDDFKITAKTGHRQTIPRVKDETQEEY